MLYAYYQARVRVVSYITIDVLRYRQAARLPESNAMRTLQWSYKKTKTPFWSAVDCV